MPASRESRKLSPAAELTSYIDRLDPAQQKLFKSLRSAVRKRLPTANELAYDYGSSIVIAYSPSERGIEGIVSIGVRADGVRLYFNEGPRLPDPKKLLKGAGKATRFIMVESSKQVTDPDVEALFVAAIKAAKVALPKSGKGALMIRTSDKKG